MLISVSWKCLNIGILATLVIFLSSVSAENRNVSKSRLDSNRLAQISVQMKSLVSQGTIAGAVTFVAWRDEIVSFEAVGYQDLETRKPMRIDTIFDTRSITKPITATGILILMEEGKLALDDPVGKYLPEFKTATQKPQKTNAPITILHLLTHTSGLPVNRPPEIEDITIKRDRALSDVVAILSKQEAEFEPGTQHRYCSGGFAILGRVIEVVSGQPYDQFIKQHIFDPLGMKDSFFFIPDDKESRVASVYKIQDGKLRKWQEIEEYRKNAKYPGPEFGMYSTASDLASLCQMILDGGTFRGKRILAKTFVETMIKNQTNGLNSATTMRAAYQGLGWGLSGDPMSDLPLISAGSFGHDGAFGTLLWVDPNERLIRIFLEQLYGFGDENRIFMTLAGSALTD